MIDEAVKAALKAEEIYKKLISSNSIDDITDTIDSLDENMAKLVLRKFVYARVH